MPGAEWVSGVLCWGVKGFEWGARKYLEVFLGQLVVDVVDSELGTPRVAAGC